MLQSGRCYDGPATTRHHHYNKLVPVKPHGSSTVLLSTNATWVRYFAFAADVLECRKPEGRLAAIGRLLLAAFLKGHRDIRVETKIGLMTRAQILWTRNVHAQWLNMCEGRTNTWVLLGTMLSSRQRLVILSGDDATLSHRVRAR
jgi:hypothetical protein